MQWPLKMILSRNRDAEKPAEQAAGADQSAGDDLKAPTVRVKLDEAVASLAELESEMAAFALAAAEEKAGASQKLSAHRTKIDAAARHVTELQAALHLAERIDRQAAVSAAAKMRDEQLTEFKMQFAAREKAMAAVLKAAADMALAYGEYSEATLRTLSAVPAGTHVPMMSIGSEGFAGPAFGPCTRLILAELYRLAPEREDGIGRFVLEFAKPSSEFLRGKPDSIKPGIEGLIEADAAIVTDIGKQIERLNDQAARAAGMTTDDRKDAA